MPTYSITSPDGRKFRVTAPDGASQEDVLAYAQANMPAAAPDEAPQVEDPGVLGSIGIAAGRASDKIVQGLGQAVSAIPAAFGSKKHQAIADARASQQKAADEVYKPLAEMHPVATGIGETVPYLATGNPLLMGAMAASEYGDADERAVKGSAAFVGGKLGEKAGTYIANKLAARAQNAATKRASDRTLGAARDATLNEAQAAGYAIPPTQANPDAPGLVNRVLEGVSGKIQTGQAFAIKNQEVTTKLAKQALHLPEDVPLTREAIGNVRSAAGEVYRAVKGFGQVNVDDEFRAALNGVGGEYTALVRDVPSQKNGSIDALLADLGRDTYSANTIVEWVKRLRHDGFKNVTNLDPEKVALGRVQIGAQNALEDLLERRLVQAGDEGAIEAFRRARALIAKSYTVEKALEESTGKVIASKIGKEFSKGRPLTGELATIGRAAEAFPKALQNVNSSMPGLSPLDAGSGAMMALISGQPLMAALPLVRPGIRSLMSTGPYQRTMVKAPTYDPALIEKLIAEAGRRPDAMKRLGGLLGAGGLPGAL